MEWFVLRNPFLESESSPPGLFAVTDNREIIGQFRLNESRWHFGSQRYKGFFGYDYFVKKPYRQQGIGAFLFVQCIRQFSPFFGLGVTTHTRRISQILGLREIGFFQKYLWFNKYFSSINHFANFMLNRGRDLKKISEKDFPHDITIEGRAFRLLENLSSWPHNEYYDDGLISFNRSREFLNWRFFQSLQRYSFYYLDHERMPIYFVVRGTVFKGMNLLLLVDYKVPLGDKELWLGILRAAKSLANKMDFDGLITTATHHFFGDLLLKEKFMKAGGRSPIVSTFYNSFKKEKISEEVSIYATLADADLDLNFQDAI